MYAEFYGLTQNPFDLTPDPAFFWPMPCHEEALATLWYGLQQRKGFIVITGEVGTGKTLLLRCLLRGLSRQQAQVSYIFNPRLTALEFLHYMAADFGVGGRRSKSELLWELNRWLITNHNKGSMSVLIVDEAHLLDWDVLEEIRLLTNLETAQHKLIQIVLSGQPELQEKLDRSELRQLKQRIVFQTKLLPMTEAQTCSYIWQRLQKAGMSVPEAVFPKSICGTVFRLSGGIPRLINTICENALISGFARQVTTVTTDIIRESAEDCGLSSSDVTTVDGWPAEHERDSRHCRTASVSSNANLRTKVFP
ncbi:MAG TPA: AAA family ATPase [Terriglobales bacterium]|nr:AAA family ATPase [Terriglobales bacterium]